MAVVSVLLVAAGLSSLLVWRRTATAEVCVITAAAGRTEIKLPADTTLEFAGPVGRTVVRVSGRTAWVVESDCPEKRCVRQGRIGRAAQAVVCVPNKVVVRLTGRGELDGITR
ncbi:MAG: NusG domain II-containing protein [candidate division WOR-3 bacterium]